ncbi:DUF5712 family protein [Hymenobacter sp. BT770]|uniref:DUF5712 family protein n=1 Tax=Hymenobacter sp. BT770 TaxID=2886942 RepID=UPI001D0FF4DE|nr:DUF5712 family protein [Hymenobacter sp. BT770]MCC3155216.1 DUF5712 family protein [Hymenobacter sp. BT770]MDO3417171.1 DUF5712 family protein [Hymenobacter sp. BT770]
MIAKIPSSGAGLSQRSGSCAGLVAYLEKEVQGEWFSLESEDVPAAEVTQALDRNKRNLNRDADKYYQVILAPSQAELRHIGSDPEKLRAYTRAAMEQYAANFGKGIEGKDLVYFAKVEHERTTGPADRAVQVGEVKRGQAKAGEQTHIHILVSRTENLARYTERKQAGELERKNPYHLSPLTNHKDTQRGVVTGGFARKQYSERVEQAFDRVFGYDRPLSETFRYAYTMQHGTTEECAVLRTQALREQHQRQAVQEAAQQKQPQRGVAPASPTPAPEKGVTPAVERTNPKPERSRGIGM